jgi:hypothetical protein
MIPIQGTAAILIAPSSPLQTSGYVPGNPLGAQTFNWYLYHLTAELNNLLGAAGISQNTAVDTQVAQAANAVALANAIAVQGNSILVSGTTSYNMPTSGSTTFLVSVPAGSGSALFNVPSAASIIGSAITVVKIDTGSGVVKGVLNGSDLLNGGSAAFLLGSPYQSITIKSIGSGKISVIGGSFVPDQSVDPYPGSNQYHLGKLIHLPLNNTTSRVLTTTLPSSGNWTSAVQAAGLVGIPSNAKAIRAKIRFLGANTTGSLSDEAQFSDNVSNTPSSSTDHPGYGVSGPASGPLLTVVEIDIPLNSLGQFFIYRISATGGTVSAFTVTAVGYYMGD